MKIRGNTVGTSNPKPDFKQEDANRADYIKNKPNPMPLPASAEVGQYIRVKEVDSKGQVLSVEAVSMSGGGLQSVEGVGF